MNDNLLAGILAIGGTALGWTLSEVGAGTRGRAERQRIQRAEARGRVFEAASVAATIAEGIRWLIRVDVAKALHGEAITGKDYDAKVIELASQLTRMQLIPLDVSANGPRTALPDIEALAASTESLMQAFEETPRATIGENPTPLLTRCKAIMDHARQLITEHA